MRAPFVTGILRAATRPHNIPQRKLRSPGTADSAYQIAEAFAWHGERDRAFDWLERAFGQRDPGLQYTRSDPLLRLLHGDARWKPFLRRLNLPAE